MGFLSTLFSGGGSRPEAPDPFETAQSEMLMNNQNIFTPTGSVEYGHMSPEGVWTAGAPGEGQQGAVRVNESEFQTAIREGSESGALSLQGSILGEPMLNREEEAQRIYDSQVGMLTQNFERDAQRGETRLQNRGLPVGSEGFSDGMMPIYDAQSDALSNLSASSYNQADQSRQTDIGNRWQAILGGSGVSPTMSAPNPSNVNLSGMVQDQYAQDMNAWNEGNSNQMKMWGGLAGMAGGFI